MSEEKKKEKEKINQWGLAGTNAVVFVHLQTGGRVIGANVGTVKDKAD